MKRFFILICIFLSFSINAEANFYTTNFPNSENPISESNHWTNGKTTGVDWSDIVTTPGLAYGTQAGNFVAPPYNDSIAVLTGTWGPDQYARAVAHCSSSGGAFYEEVEILLRFSITAHNAHGYEVVFSCPGMAAGLYSGVVRWNGALNDFTILVSGLSGPQYGVSDGDVIEASIVGNLITVKRNGSVVTTVTDNTWTTGNPGMGFYNELGGSGANADHGHTSYTASNNPIGTAPDTTGPAVAITSHTNNQTVTSSPITVAGTASDSGLGNSGISSVTINGVAASGGTASGSGTANWSQSVALSAGANTITVIAKDASANQNSTTTSITVNYTPPDTTGPAVAITSHSNNQTVTSSPITVAGTASDSGLGNSGISSVTVNGVAASGGAASGSGTANWSQSVALNAGANTITVVAKDASANQNSTTVQITINLQPNQPPDGTITSPASNVTIVTGQSVNFQAMGTDPDNNLPLSYQWTFGGGAPNSSLQNPGLITFSTQGVYTVTLSVTDSLGLADPTPATRTITVSPPVAVAFVEPAGMCNGNTPCFTAIQQATAVVALGGTIKVAQGTYHENLSVNTSKNFILEGGWNSNFTTRATDPALTVIDGDLTGDGVGEGAVLALDASTGENINLTIERVTIQNGNNVDGGGISAMATATGLIDLNLSGNMIRNNKSTNTGGGIGLYAQGSGSKAQATLTNNMIYGNDTAGEGAGIFAYSDNSGNVALNLINNTITDNASTGTGGGLRVSASNGSATDVTVTNNILWGSSAAVGHDIAIHQSSGGTATVHSSYNDVGDVAADVGAPGTYNDLGNNIDADPLFVNFAGGDLHLGSGSPALDIGTATGAPATDFEADARPQGPGYDLGADERIAGPLAISVAALPGGQVGVGYSAPLGVSGGQSPCAITVSSGILPSGLSLAGPNIVGSPKQAGKKTFTIKVTDQLGASVSRKYTLSISKALTLSTSSLTSGKVSRSYNATVKAANGKTPYNWLIASGSLPAGLVFNNSTGKISGIPLSAGGAPLTFQVTDPLGGKAQKTLTLTIN